MLQILKFLVLDLASLNLKDVFITNYNPFLFLGNNPKTLYQKQNHLKHFQTWCNGKDLIFEDLLKDEKALQFRLVQYLESYRVKDKASGELVRPKTNTMNKMNSMLKSELSRLSGK